MTHLVETHTALLIFLGDRVYKLKKPVDLGFVGYRSRIARLAACQAEVALNRGLARDVHLGVADVMGPDGEPCEHLVVMRRLPDERRLATLIREGKVVDVPLSAQAVRQLWQEGLRQLTRLADGILTDAEIARTRALALRYLDGRGPLFADRVDRGFVRDGHGDLQAEDV